ncbi:MAG TPA: hypothetical protein VGV17_16990 [Bosea sp. (in: a-proteobacteria)]|jgi:hypothetical protein|uniref:hypothetical protein n=1 Tax=Bosea sp. (in: a-proteobacteria) TaxID=1871050 RepID=UPI002DDD87F4|nr:hypothetical protein [Bosea sp. (in: a-proteobacteria)]HEV2555452.1 hypothetical protein [Bosea sp. (in: a-proteobacteria)]
MARKRKETTPPTDGQLPDQAAAAHHEQLTAAPLPDTQFPAAPAEDVPLYPSTPGELLDAQGVVPAEGAAQDTATSGEPESPVAHPAAARGHQEPHGGRRGVDKRVVNGIHLNLIDDGNYGGMGVQIDVEQPGDKPTPDETAVLKEGGLRYRAGEWRGGIDRRDPAGSRGQRHKTFDRFAEKFAERDGGGPAR